MIDNPNPVIFVEDPNKEFYINLFLNEGSKDMQKYIRYIGKVFSVLVSFIVLIFTCSFKQSKYSYRYMFEMCYVMGGKQIYELKREEARKVWLKKFD